MYPSRDRCFQGEGLCQARGEACQVGVMGWLSVCRAGYSTGVDVLYGTNSFCVQGSMMDMLSSGVILKTTLERVKALELVWEDLVFGRDGGGDREKVVTSLAGLAEVFPGLRRLVVSFGDVYNDFRTRPARALAEIEKVLLQPLAKSMSRLGKLENVVVEMPSNIFRDLNGADGVTGLGLDKEKRGREWVAGEGLWLRYPVSSSVPLWIKEGVESNLFWDYNGQHHSYAFLLVCGHFVP